MYILATVNFPQWDRNLSMMTQPGNLPTSNRQITTALLAGPKFKCTVPNCTFMTRRMALLKNHMKSHSQEKTFTKCRFCSYSTLSRSNCKVHEQRMHLFQRPHKCRYCPYSCVQSSTLRQHVQMKHKNRCQYVCCRCPNFYCQRESQLMFHLLKVHQVTCIAEISPFLNSNYLPDHLFPVSNVPRESGHPSGQADDGVCVISSSTVKQQTHPSAQLKHHHQQQQQQHNQPVVYSNKRYGVSSQKALPPGNPTASQYQFATTVSNDYVPSDSIMQQLSQPSYPSQGEANTSPTVQTPPLWNMSGSTNSARTVFPRDNRTIIGIDDLPERSMMMSASLIPSLNEQPEVIEIVESERSADTPLEMRLQDGKPTEENSPGSDPCPAPFSNEDRFIHHIMSDHSAAETLDQSKTAEGSKQTTPKGDISSSSVFMYSVDQQTTVVASPVPVALSQSILTPPLTIKQEQLESPTADPSQEEWTNRSHSDYEIVIKELTAEQEQLNSDPLTSVRENTPMLDMPSPTTTHCNIATASTQTTPLSTSRGAGCSSKFCCPHCKIIFPDSVLFMIHRGAHGFHSPFECNLCGKDCGNKYEFATHLHNCY